MRDVAVNSLRDVSAITVEEVNWSVSAGDFWVIGGLHGSGKSDLLMLAGGMSAPARGTYFFRGQEMPIFEDERMAERLRIGFVFEEGQLLNNLTIAENIALPLRYHNNLTVAEADTEVGRILEATELSPWADSTPSAIARNWRKRAGLARALIMQPDVLLLDNPIAGLDTRQRSWWLNFLDELSRGCALTGGRPLTLVVTTNGFNPWQSRARKFAMLKEKRLVVLGDWAQVQAADDELVRELSAAPQSV